MQNYTIEKTLREEEISRENFNSINPISVYRGLCRANKDNPSQPRDIQWYDENVLKPMIERGEISDGSKGGFDDRKMRYDGATINYGELRRSLEKELFIHLGHSHFLEYREKRKRAKDETEELTQLGIIHFKDPYAFFPRNPGVTGIVLTSDKKIVIGRRNVEQDRYEGLLQGAAGHLTYKDNPKDVNLDQDMLMELREEMGVLDNQINRLEFIGLFSDPSVAGDDLDFCYLINADIHSDYFTRGVWRERVKKPEHSEFYAIPNYNSLEELVNTGNFKGKNFDIIFSTRGALATLIPQDFE